jgi:uncharacterized protein (TIRG00374 family)
MEFARENRPPADHRRNPANPVQKKNGRVIMLKILLALLFLYLLYHYRWLQFSPLVRIVEEPLVLGLLILLAWLTFPLCAIRWQRLLDIQKIHMSFTTVFRALYLSTFIGLFLPGSVGGDVVRFLVGSQHSGERKMELGLSVVMDRVLGLFGLFGVGLIFCLCYLTKIWNHPTLRDTALLLTTVFLCLLTAVILIGLCSDRIRQKQSGIDSTPKGYLAGLFLKGVTSIGAFRQHTGTLMKGWVLSLVVHAKNVAIIVILAKMVDIGPLGIWEYGLAGTMTFFVNIIPLTPDGLGMGEASFSQVLNLLSPQSVAVAYATIFLMYRLIKVISLLPALLWLPGSLRKAA